MAASADGFRRSVDEALDALLEWRNGGADEPPAGGVGEALDGAVRAEATAMGRIDSLEIAPEAWAQSPGRLVDAVMEAVNAALRQRDRRLTGAPDAGDPDGVVARLEQVQQEATARMDEFLWALSESHLRINQRLEE